MSLSGLNCLQSIWNLSFLKSSELRKTSLNSNRPPLCPRNFHLQLNEVRNDESAQSSPRPRLPNSKPNSHRELKRDVDTPARADKEKKSITEKDFRIMQILRSDKNFKMYMVRKENDDRVYAMKLIAKKRIEKNSIADQITMEKEILEKARHPFIPKLDWYFENDKKVFFVMEFVEEGAAFDRILKQLTRFSEEITRFYSAEILTILEYLHNDIQVAHNDLRLKNFMLDSNGHIKLIGYSLAKKIQTEQPQQQTSSPVLRKVTPDETTDFWQFGCLLYELLTGRKPFSQGEEELSEPEELSPTTHLYWPCRVSKNAKDLISRLLNRDIEERMRLEDIKQHVFFSQVNWEKVMNKSIFPPFNPAQFQENEAEQEDVEDEFESPSVKYLQVPSLEKIIENTPSLLNSEEGVPAMSYGRTTRFNSLLGYH